jgi:RNA-directed DNA polymerase
LQPQKTKIVYCKDLNRPSNFPVIAFDFLGFQFRARKTMWRKGGGARKALKAIGRTVRAWVLQLRSDKSLQELAAAFNSHLSGWITCYSQFYKTQYRVLKAEMNEHVSH